MENKSTSGWVIRDTNGIIQMVMNRHISKGELCFGGRRGSKLTKGSYNSSNWVEGYEIVMNKYTLKKHI